MFFPERIKSIGPQYRVLEIGPGSFPHPRSDAFLELDFRTGAEKLAQRGGTPDDAKFGKRPVYYYAGDAFPFADNQFDYVICSHVVEHVENPEAFMREVFRVGQGRGYIEYPMITYEYLYNFDVHLNFVKYQAAQRILSYLPKRDTAFGQFAGVSAIFYKTLQCGWDDLCAGNQELFFEGFEFERPFAVEKAPDLGRLLPPQTLVREKSRGRRLLDRIATKLGLR